METKLEVYTFKVRERGQKQDYETLTSVMGNDFMKFISSFIAQFDKSLLINKEIKRSFQVMEKSIKLASDKRSISGVIESGDYGDETKIVSPTGKHKYTKASEDLAIRPFYFLINIPTTGYIGYIILQRNGVHGINNLFQQSLTEYFDLNYPDHKIDIGQFMSKELLHEFIKNGGIQEFILTRYNLPKDVTNKLNLDGISQSIKGIEIRILAKNKNFFGMNKEVTKFLNNNNAYFFDAKPLKEMGFDKNYEIAVKVKKGDKTRTIDLSDSGQIRPYYNIDNEVKKDNKTGHPVFGSIDSIAKDLLNDLTATT